MCYDGKQWVEYEGSNEVIGITIDATNFPDENFRNWLLHQNYGRDGVLTEEEIDGITFINVRDKEISSLKGIEYFTALTKLRCSENQLTALNVSKNTALTELTCYKNQLTALDVSKNTELTRLECYKNQLTALDISKNTELYHLYCYDNQLTALDVSKNTAMKNLRCENNQLTALDVSKNTAMEYLWCENNQLTALDVSKNTALESLLCSGNQLTALDVSKNTVLTTLICNNNQLTALNVSKNTALKQLFCQANQLTALDVSKNMALERLGCYENRIKGTAMDALISSLPYRSSGGYFHVYYNSNNDEGNICTKSQVSAVKAKGWTAYYGTNLEEYEGSEDLVSDETIVVSSAGYATFYSSESAYTLPNGLSAQVVTSVANGKLTYKTIADGSVSGIVPKGTAVMLVSDAKRAGTYTLTPTESSASYSGTNLLRGSDDATMTSGDGYHYKLSYGRSGSSLNNVFGWYWGAANGGSFQIDGHKAWLVVPKSSATRGYSIGDEATGITDVEADDADAHYYDLQGRSVSKPQRKGVYIKNGQRVIIK